jgi:hypothetical protein
VARRTGLIRFRLLLISAIPHIKFLRLVGQFLRNCISLLNGVPRMRAPQHKAGWLYLIDAMGVPGEWVQRRQKALYLVGGFSA